MKIYVVVGYNGILRATGIVGASLTREGAEKIQRDNDWKMDKSDIQETEFDEERNPSKTP